MEMSTFRGMVGGMWSPATYHMRKVHEHFQGYGTRKVSTFRDMVPRTWIRICDFLHDLTEISP